MRNNFVRTSNVQRFEDAIARVEARSVPERGICVVSGQAGFGKSRAGLWWGLHHNAVMISVFPLATPAWLLRDLVRELGESPRRSAEDVRLQAVAMLAANPRPVLVDEVEHALDRGAVALDALRSIADICEVPLILIGREGTLEKLNRHTQLRRRIGARTLFAPLSAGDIHLMAGELAEAEISAEVLAAIHANCEGRVCSALAAIAAAERAGIKAGRPARLADLDFTMLGHPWLATSPRVASLAAARRRAQ
jgi:hypothetical protein